MFLTSVIIREILLSFSESTLDLVGIQSVLIMYKSKDVSLKIRNNSLKYEETLVFPQKGIYDRLPLSRCPDVEFVKYCIGRHLAKSILFISLTSSFPFTVGMCAKAFI